MAHIGYSGRCDPLFDAVHRARIANAPDGPIGATAGHVLLFCDVGAHLARYPASRCDALLVTKQNYKVRVVPFELYML